MVDEKPVSTKTRMAEYDRRGIRLTNVLYYPELQQLSFGYIYSDDEQEKYNIALLDADGRNVPGVLLVSGRERSMPGICKNSTSCWKNRSRHKQRTRS